MWNSLARSLLVTCLIHDRWLCEKPCMKRISGPFGLPQSCAEMVRPSGVFTETALNVCSCAWPDVARVTRNAATDIPARDGVAARGARAAADECSNTESVSDRVSVRRDHRAAPTSSGILAQIAGTRVYRRQEFHFEIREARGDVDRLPKLASEIVDTHPDVIVAVTSPASAAAKMATQTIPIVMAIVPDPVGLGLVESLARPGTNITSSSSLTIEIIPKRVQLIKEILPELSIMGMLWNEKVASNRLQFQSAEQAARSLGVPLRSFPVQGPEDLQPILNKVSEGHVSALLVAGDLMLFDRRADVIAFSL